MSDSTRNNSVGCLAGGLAFLIVWIPGAAAYYLALKSEVLMGWFIARFQGVMALAVGVTVVLGSFWGLVGLFKIVRAGLLALMAGESRRSD